jgi:hypothetical protein
MSQYVEESVKSFTAGAAIGQHTLVKLTTGKLAAAALTEEPLGTLLEASFADGDVRPVRLRSAEGTMLCKAANAITAGAVVYGRASGLVDDVATSAGIRIGVALEAATATNDIIEVLPC